MHFFDHKRNTRKFQGLTVIPIEHFFLDWSTDLMQLKSSNEGR